MPTVQIADHINQTLRNLESTGVLPRSTVLLLGSSARRTQTWRSDIDILVITLHETARWRVPAEVHLHVETRDKFIARLLAKEDFPAWALRYGVVVHDSDNWWKSIQQNPNLSSIWPDWRLKLPQARKRLEKARELLTIGDTEASTEQLLLASALAARAILLKAGIFPLSRPEIPSQSTLSKDLPLANALRALESENQTEEKLHALLQVIESTLSRLEALAISNI